VIHPWPPEVDELMQAARVAMVPGHALRGRDKPLCTRPEVERLVPHRGSFLFIDEVAFVDRATATIGCRYDLARSDEILADHFPGNPVWPGVLAVEAVGQAGICLTKLLKPSSEWREVTGNVLTHILGAEFVRPVLPQSRLDIVARAVPDGLFTIIVGQCLQHDQVCCIAAVRGITE
jgi:3-hydroxymyristoyl/3-hydroxydecanoyl-(acyl carrier protein) dehydratase